MLAQSSSQSSVCIWTESRKTSAGLYHALKRVFVGTLTVIPESGLGILYSGRVRRLWRALRLKDYGKLCEYPWQRVAAEVTS